MKKLKPNDIMNLALITIIPFPCFAYYAIHFYNMFAPHDMIGRNVCLIIICAFLWGMVDIIRHFLSIIREHDHLNLFQESFSPEKENLQEHALPESIIYKRYQTILSLKNSLSDVSHHMLTEIISSRESGRTIVASYLMGACVMLGLFGSFLGLLETVGGVYSAIESIDNSGKLLNSLSRPLSGMSLTFGTSIVGIIASLSLGFSFIFLNRRQISFLSDLEAFTQTTLIPAMSVSSVKKHQDILSRLENIEKNTGTLNDIRDTLQQDAQKVFVAIDGYYANLTRSTQDKIAENTDGLIHIQQGMRRDAEKAFSSIDTHYSNLSKTIQETLAKTMTGIKDNVSESFSSLTATTTRSIKDIHSTMETSVTKINDSISKEMQTFLSEERNAIAEMLDRVKASTDKGQQATQDLSENVTHGFDTFLEKERTLVQEMLDQVTRSNQDNMHATGLLSENLTHGIQDFLAGERVQIQEMIEKINASGQTTLEANRMLLSDYLRNNQDQMHTFLTETQKSSQSVMDSFTEKYGQFFEQEVSRATSLVEEKTSLVIHEAMKNNKELFEQNMTLFSRSTEEFTSLGLALRNMHELYSERLNQTTQAINQAISGFSNTLQQEQDTSKHLSERNDQIIVLLQETAALLQSNQTEMQAGLAMFVQGVDSLLTSFQIKEQDKKAEKTMVQNLEKSLNTLTDKTENVLLEYVAKSREIYSGLLDNQLHLTRKIKELSNDN